MMALDVAVEKGRKNIIDVLEHARSKVSKSVGTGLIYVRMCFEVISMLLQKVMVILISCRHCNYNTVCEERKMHFTIQKWLMIY